MQDGCLYYLKIVSSIIIACLVVNGSLVWNVMSLKFWYASLAFLTITCDLLDWSLVVTMLNLGRTPCRTRV